MDDLDKTIVIEASEKRAYKCPLCGEEMQPYGEHKRDLRCPSCMFVQKAQSVIAPGQVIINKYRVLSNLSHGAFGDIFLCHPLDDQSVRYIIKLLKTDSGNSVKRFRREAEVLASLQNDPRIAKIIDFWEEDGSMFIIMEYIRGINLRQAKAKYAFDEEAVWQIAKEIVSTLQFIWDNYSIIHRDIKPDNIMLDEEFHVKILDFGLCKQCGLDSMAGITVANASLGTPGYMSPEQFTDSKHVDFRSDIFSLGATLFFLLTGRPPFVGQDLDQIHEQTLLNSPPPPEMLQEFCSPEGIAIIRSMMCYHPEDRWDDYADLLCEIRRHLRKLRGN